MHVYPHPCSQFLNAVDTNLFQLGSTNPKKNFQALDVFFGGRLSPPPKKQAEKNMLILFLFKISNLFFKNVQIYMKDAECGKIVNMQKPKY